MSEEENVKQATTASKLQKMKPVHLIILLLVFITLFSLFQLYKAQQELKEFKTNPEQAASKEIEEIIDNVGKLIDLPEGEIPTIATVTDPEKLKDQAFFSTAKVGDKVLIYNNARRAILYRPSSNKVIDTAPINIGDTSIQQSEENVSEETSFIILNGTTVAGLAGKYQNTLEGEVSTAKIVSIGNAQTTNVEKSFIVDSSGEKTSQLNSLANLLKIETGTLPADQLDSKADFIIVVGTDQN